MEGDAGSGQLTPPPPLTADEAIESVGAPDTSPTGGSPTPPASRLTTGRWLTGLCVAVGIGSLALIAVGVLALLGGRQTAAATRDEDVAVAVAKECVAATQAPDVKAMAESQRKIVDCASENFAPQANLYGGLLVDAYETVQAQVKISDIRAAAEKHNSDGSIDVLVATRVAMSNMEQQGQEISYRLRVKMVPDGDTYRVDSIEPVGK